MSQVIDQITAEENARAQEQVSANIVARLQAARQSALDRKANIDQEVADYEAEIAARVPQAPAEAPQTDENGHPVPAPDQAQG